MNKFIIFMKSQYILILILTTFLVIPFYLSTQYLSKVPYVPYFFLIILFFYKFYIMNDKKYQGSISGFATRTLEKELKKNPSSKEIFDRKKLISTYRDIVIGVVSVTIISIGLIFEKF